MAWRGWYHCMSSTYGTWLPGDPRGFRTRAHKEHIEGDYKNPPPKGKYDERHRASRTRMKRRAVILPPALRSIVLDEVRGTLQQHRVDVIAVSVSGTHLHVLARFPRPQQKPTFSERGLRTSAVDDPVRHLMGIAKQWSSKRLIREGHFDAGIWAKRGKIKPIAHRKHQVNTFTYILDHAREGAAVWSCLDPV